MSTTTNVQREPSRKNNWAQASMAHRSGDDAWMAKDAAQRAHVAKYPDYRTRPDVDFWS